MGQSTGGAITMDYVINHADSFKKVILLAPLLRPMSWWLVNLFLGLTRIFHFEKARDFARNSHDDDFLYSYRRLFVLNGINIPAQAD